MASYKLKIFTLFFQLLIIILSFTLSAESNIKTTIPILSNLQLDSEIQQASNKVIMLYVSAANCVFCKKLEKEIIHPLIHSGEYNERIILRKVDWHSLMTIKNFQNEIQKTEEFLSAYQITATPTILFLDSKGLQIVKPLIGYKGDEFYWFYLDAAINKANKRLNDIDFELKKH